MTAIENGSSVELGAIEANELVRRAHSGCADSYTELARRFRPRLLSLLRSRLGDRPSDIEDVAQEALVRAFQRLDRFDPRYRFSTWLYTIAIRLAQDHARSQRRRPRQVVLNDAQRESREQNAAVRVERQEDVDNLWQLAQRILSEAQYTALWLRYSEELSTIEVARVMQRSRIGVRVLLHRARLALAAEVAKHDPLQPACSSQLREQDRDSNVTHDR
jgi:RNA polymerase sigma-70 factor (ECF subfamily)